MQALLIGAIGFALSSFVLKLFTSIGIAVFTYVGLNSLINEMLDLIQPTAGTIPANVLDIMALAGIPQGLTVITSALLTRAAINAAQAFIGVKS